MDLDCSPGEAQAALGVATKEWGGEWRAEGSGGRVALPVAAGLRRGLTECDVSIEPAGEGCRVTFEVTAAAWSINWIATMILVFGAAGGILLLLWPLFPDLLGLAPFAAIIAFSAWFLVASRLRTSSLEDYLETLAVETSPGEMEDPELVE